MKKILLSITLVCLGLVSNSFAQTIALSQNFEGATLPALPTGWVNTTAGGGNGWVTNSGTVNWPLYAITPHTKYVFVDDANHPHNNPSKLTSPTFSLAGVSNAYLAYDWFYIHAYLNAAPHQHEQAWVELSTDGGGSFNLIDSVPGFTTSVTDWSTRFVSLSGVTGTANCQLRFCYTDQGGTIIGVAIDNILVYGAVATDIGLSSVSPVAGSAAAYGATGSPVTFSGIAANYGSTAISSFTASYQVGTATPVTATISTSIPAFSTAAFSFPSPYIVTASGGQLPVKIWVTTSGETYLKNDSMNTVIAAVPFMPTKRVVFEEGTGTWCGWCVRGIVYMDSLWRADSNTVSIVSVHNSDPMQSDNATTTQYDLLTSGMISGYPSMIIDRHVVDDPSGAFDDYSQYKSEFAYANLGITTTTSGGAVTAHVKVEPAITLKGDYRLELIVTEDGVSGPAGSSWDQHNYYAPGGAGAGMPLSTIGYDFNTLPNPVTGVKFPFVARYTIPNDLKATPNGVAGSLPDSMHFGLLFTYDFAPVTIAGNWNASKLRYTVYMIDNNPADANYGYILNSSNTSSTPGFSFVTVSFVGVADVHGGIEDMTMYPNPASEMVHIKFGLKEETTVQLAIYDAVGRQVYSVPAAKMSAGGQQINVSTSDLSSGIYNVVIRTESGQISQRLSIVK